MTREDAIYWIKNLAVLSTEKDMPQIEEALKMAIEALEQTEPQTAECPFDDTIPCEWVCTEYGKCKYKPKTEPQTEGPRCDECIHFDRSYRKVGDDGVLVIGVECDGAESVCDKFSTTDCSWK